MGTELVSAQNRISATKYGNLEAGKSSLGLCPALKTRVIMEGRKELTLISSLIGVGHIAKLAPVSGAMWSKNSFFFL